MTEYRTLACCIDALVRSNVFTDRDEEIGNIEANYLPSGSGSGFDTGTKIVMPRCQPGRMLFLSTSYHHANEDGHCDGRTDHNIRVRPTFGGLDVTVSGPDRDGVKDYIYDMFYCALSSIEYDIDQRYEIVLERITDAVGDRAELITLTDVAPDRKRYVFRGKSYDYSMQARKAFNEYSLRVLRDLG